MAFLEFSFKATNTGDSSSTTTDYIVEMVDCSNTSVPLSQNGYLFRTTLTGKEKTGTITGTFDNIPPNTIIPVNSKLKITGTKNGKPLVIYQTCNPAQLVICAENQPSNCSISNVQLAQVICGETTISVPFSFITDKVGAYKVELFRVSSNTVPVSVTVFNINVTNPAALQTGSISLSTLDSDTYKLYISKNGANDVIECINSSNTTLLSCSTTGNCIAPTFDIVGVSPSCTEGEQTADGTVTLSNIVSGQKVRYCPGQVWNCNDNYNDGIDITDTNSFILFNNYKITGSQAYDFFVVRVYKDPSCYTDKVVKLTKPDCNADLCNYVEVYNAQSSNKFLSYKNTGVSAKRIDLRFSPQDPTQLVLYRNNIKIFDSFCNGISTVGCSNCGQGGIICGHVFLQPNDRFKVHINPLCSKKAISNWALESFCTPIISCLTSIEFGATTSNCGITIPTNAPKFTCNNTTGLVDLEVTGQYGAISTEYEFGYEINDQWSNVNEVVWESTNKKIGLPKNTDIVVWVRDKNNTTCYTQLPVKTPGCINIIPKLKQATVKQFFNQTGSRITVDADNIENSGIYDVKYNYIDEPGFTRGGDFDKTAKLVSLPVVSKSGTIEISLINIVNGAVSNKVYFNVLDENNIFNGSVLANVCVTGQTDTYLSANFTKINSLLPYIVEIRDALTSSILYTTETNDPENIKIKHNEISTDVTIQVYSKTNPLKGSQLIPFKLVKQNCSVVSPACCIENLAYTVNALGNANAVDSVGFYYKANCVHGYRMYIESETNRGVYELYDTQTTSQPVTLSAPYNVYNRRPIQALATRVWRNKGFKVKFEFTSPQGAVIQTAEVVLNITSSTTINTPFNVYNCTDNHNNGCSLTDKDDYGDSILGGGEVFDVQSRVYNGQWYLVTAKRNSPTDIHFVRGINFLDNNSTLTLSKNVPRSCFSQETSANGGFSKPDSVQPPTGYRLVTTGDGAQYFEIGSAIPPYPCNDVNCTPYSGVIPSQSGGTTYYVKLLYERYKMSEPSNSAARARPFASRAELVELMALYAQNPSSPPTNSNGFNANFDFVTLIKNGVYKEFFEVDTYLLNNNNPPFDLGVAQCGFFAAPLYKSDGTTPYPLTDRYKIITTNPCGKIINVEDYIFGNSNTGGDSSVTMSQVAGTQPTYQGILSPYTHQNDVTRMNISVFSFDSITNQVEFRDGINFPPFDGKAIKYEIDSYTMYDTLVGKKFDARYPVLIRKIAVDLSRPSYEWGVGSGDITFSFIKID